MAEFILKKLVRDIGAERDFEIASAATSAEEIGNPVYPPARRKLAEHGISCAGKTARQIRRRDYEAYDYIIGMDDENMWDMKRIYGGDPEGKLSLLLSWAGKKGQEIDDPWYTRDFTGALRQIEEGCEGLMRSCGKT
jgi:protein-tyrosine phosphatase